MDEAEPPKTEAVQTSGAHTAFNPLLLFQSVVWGRCKPISRGLWDLQRTLETKVPMGSHIIAVGRFHVFLPQSNGFC